MRLYRQHITIILLQTLLTLFAFTACTRDDMADGIYGNRYEEGDTCLVYFKIDTGDSNMRATTDDSENGDEAKSGNSMHRGEVDEYKIGRAGNYAFFFDENKNFYTMSALTLTNEENSLHNGYIEDCYTTKFIATRKKPKLPRYCLVVLNGQSIYNQLTSVVADKNKTYTLDDILDQIWESSNTPQKIGRNDEGLFVMTNSVYVDENGKLINAVEIDPDKHIIEVKDVEYPDIFTPEATEEQIVHVHVERMVSKFSFQIKSKEIKTQEDLYFEPKIKINGSVEVPAAPIVFFDEIDDEGNVQYVAKKWRVKVTGWGINALETKERIFKKIKTNEDYFENWSAPSYFCSYWSEDLHYNQDESGRTYQYPLQYRKAIDKKPNYKSEIDYYKKFDEENRNALRNYSYNYFLDETTEDADDEHDLTGFNRYVYTPENTYDPTLYQNINSENYLDERTSILAGSHLIVCAELQVESNDEDAEEGYKSIDIYRDRNGIYYDSEKSYFRSLVHTFNNMLKSQRTMDFNLYNWNWEENNDYHPGIRRSDLTAKTANRNDASGKTVYYRLFYHDDIKGYIELTDEYIDELSDEAFKSMIRMSPATIEHGDGKLLPWLEENKLTIRTSADESQNIPLEIWTRDKIVEEEVVVDGKTFTVHKTIPGEFVVKATEYDYLKSLLYEWLGAVDHFSDGKMYYTAPVWHQGAAYKDPQKEADQNRLGDHAVVRNNWYRFNLKEINNIGVPVDDPNQPVIPERIDNKDVLNVKIEFIPWHIVESVADIF